MLPEEARKSLPVESDGGRWQAVVVIRLSSAEVEVGCRLRPELLEDDVELLVASEELLI